jgi:hypothetical protein
MPKMKFLSLAALLALCVGLCSGAAFAAGDSWAEIGSTFPASLMWDEGAAVSVDTDNDGLTTWDATYALKSVEGITGAAVTVDRWVTTTVSVVGTVTPTQTYKFDFNITAPPITTIAYRLPIGPTSVATSSALDCNWILDKGGLIITDTSVNPVTITRFSDNAPGSLGAWAAWQIEECAGRVPMIVQGYGGGIYGPRIEATRNQMAVFMQRAFQLPLSNYTGGFADLNPGDWADDQIQSCVDAGIVQGYPGIPLPYYLPLVVVDRGQMAVFVARGMAGGESGVPSGPPTATFPDVPVGAWNYNHVEYAVANDVVQGYPGTPPTYQPAINVTRDQMAVFAYRAAVQPTPSNVILAGPAVSAVNIPAYDGYSSIDSGLSPDPGFAYVGIDAVRASAAGLTIDFELRLASAPTGAAVASFNTVVGPVEMGNWKLLAAGSGNPYGYKSWDIPALLPANNYILVVSLDGVEALRRPAFTITP